ncbi:MAG: urea transporter [Sphingobacteriales bacterium JAD_PAG50586_3]|nr:MAG: urea transporter [Sphingobacteriales bacterium JAD_PAG50586_3]
MIKKHNIQTLAEGIVHSYAQIFFSQDKVLGLLLMLCTFLDPVLGVCGLFAVMLANLVATFLGFDKTQIREGIFGFNALLLGMAIGYDYRLTPAFWVVLSFAILLAIIVQAWLTGILSKQGLPVVSLPFILTAYIVTLAIRQTQLLEVVNHNAYLLDNTFFNPFGVLDTLEEGTKSLSFPTMIKGYFLSLGAIFFQAKLATGVLVGIGLLYHSRIAFSLTLLSFCWAWVCIDLAGAEMHWLKYQAGANFIFIAIAVGCFYIVPSLYSYLSVMLLVPLTIMAHLAFFKLFSTWMLPVYTLAFSFITIVFLAMLRARSVHQYLQLIVIQYYSPEKTIYKSLSSASRYKNNLFKHIQLPFWGDWFVSQGHNGKHTHLGDWSKAFDFIILDSELKQYHNGGTEKEDYYCYNKPVIAPADGHVIEVVDYVDDNNVAAMDMQKNWGNSIVIDHGDNLYSQLSHLKKDSLKVQAGSYVKKVMLLHPVVIQVGRPSLTFISNCKIMQRWALKQQTIPYRTTC